jgi:NAD+ synthase (glutamine-hydrolysing)
MEGNKKFSTAYVYTNLIGNEAGRAIYDGATFIASHGKILVEGKRFSFTEMQLTLASIEFDKKTENLSKLKEVKKEFSFPEKDMEAFPATIEHWETGAAIKEEEFSRAVSLGLFDYLRKSKSQGFVVSLSGGADSAAVSCLCALMVKFSAAEMGLKEVFKKLGLKGEPPATEAGLVRRILTCVYQATKNNTAITRDASRKVAQAIGAEFFELNVDKIVSDYVSLIENALQSKLNWKEHDMPLQNIQARVRAPSVWLIANLKNALLLATSNRSEAAVGYTTMDGDTAGGLSPISGIDKAFLRHWLKWLETIGPEGFSAISELNAITSQEPTAELRPAESFQTDEADLMPYLVLDAIERLAIRDKKMPIEIFDSIKNEFPQYQGADLLLWLERFFTLWSRNQWKRERYAPGFHLDDENLDPKTWCRFPILSGGYQRELRKLKASLR